MGTDKKEITQRDILDIFVQMKDEDRKKQVRDELVAEYKSKMELEQKKRAKSDYIIELIAQGYTLDEAQKMATEKFCF